MNDKEDNEKNAILTDFVQRFGLPIIFTVFGGMAVYFTNTATLRSEINVIHADLSKTDSEFASKISEIAARQSLGFGRLERLENSARELEMKGARRDAWEQQIKDLQNTINELRKSQAACESAVKLHEDSTREMMQNAPIGRKRSDLVLPWKPL